MLNKKALAVAATAAILGPQIAINSAQAANCNCIRTTTHRRVITHRTAFRPAKVVYETRTIEKQPIVINNYPAAAPNVVPGVIEQSAVIPPVDTYSTVMTPVVERPIMTPMPTFVHRRPAFGGIMRGAVGGGLLGGGLGAATGAIVGAAIGHHRAGRGALAGLGIGGGLGALLGGFRGARGPEPMFNAGLGNPWY